MALNATNTHVSYFWKPQRKARLMIVTPVILDIHQEDHDDQDILQVQRCS